MSAGIIEFIGPPGVGKTTLYNALCTKWQPSDSWIHQNALLTPVPAISDFKNWLSYKTKRFLNKDYSKSIPMEFGVRFAKNHGGFAGFCWKYLANESVFPEDETGFRFRSAFLLYLDFCRYQAIAEKNSLVPCLLNEGFLQKSFLTQTGSNNLRELFNTYLELVPLPKAIICLGTDNTSIIVERLINRKKTIASHVGKNRNEVINDIKNWQQQIELILSKMQSNGVVVHHLDGGLPVTENVSILLNVLSKARYAEHLSTLSDPLKDFESRRMLVERWNSNNEIV